MMWGSLIRRFRADSPRAKSPLGRNMLKLRPVRRSMEALEDRRLLALDPGHAYVDANNNFDFDAGDVALINGEVQDGSFNTDVPEGPVYTTAIQGAGLVIPNSVAIPSGTNRNYSADGNLVIGTNLTATNDILLTSRNMNVVIENTSALATPLTLTAGDDVEITAATDIVVIDETIQGGDDVELEAGGNILATSSRFTSTSTSDGEVQFVAGGTLFANLTVIQAPNVEVETAVDADFSNSTATVTKRIDVDAKGNLTAVDAVFIATGSKGEIELESGGTADLTSADLTAPKKIEVEAEGSILNDLGSLSALGPDGEIEMDSETGSIDLGNKEIRATKKIDIEAAVEVDAGGSNFTTTSSKGEVEIKAGGLISIGGGNIISPYEIEIESGSTVSLGGAGNLIHALASSGKIEIEGNNIVIGSGTDVRAGAKIDIDAVDSVFAAGAVIQTTGTSGEIEIEADNLVDLTGATLRAFKKIDIKSNAGLVQASGASIASLTGSTKGEITIKGVTYDITGATIRAAKKLTLKGTQVGGAAATTANGTLPLV